MKKMLFNTWLKKFFFGMISCLLMGNLSAQSITQLLQKAFQQFEDDSQLKYAISSLYVIDAKTGKVIFEKNSRVGLAPASTQKIITSVTAFELLGKDFRYQTKFTVSKDAIYRGLTLHVQASGDPTFGSWRYSSTKESLILQKIYDSLQNQATSNILIDGSGYLPDGYIWQDMGNYYGSGIYSLNWKENQYDVSFTSENEGSLTKLAAIGLDTAGYHFINEVRSGPVGSGDNAYIYSAPNSTEIYLRGTVPPVQKAFTISGADPDPPLSFGRTLKRYLENRWKTIATRKETRISVRKYFDPSQLNGSSGAITSQTIYTHYSPSLDSIVYWFNKKSINLYGEALVRTMGGVSSVQKFWKEHGLDENELNMEDGSGLSPLNRVTTHVQVEILKYAREREWFSYFYNALPEYNGMKMKSGTIRDVKGFCGYQKSKDGNEYIFSFLINNYNGPASMVVNKMYKVLDILK